MCCTTHEDRDFLDRAAGTDVGALLAPGEQWRCRCAFGLACGRKATGEDLLCDWCRGTDHQEFCDRAPGAGFRPRALEVPSAGGAGQLYLGWTQDVLPAAQLVLRPPAG